MASKSWFDAGICRWRVVIDEKSATIVMGSDAADRAGCHQQGGIGPFALARELCVSQPARSVVGGNYSCDQRGRRNLALSGGTTVIVPGNRRIDIQGNRRQL